ncbi:unnamed protein product [Parascedosporium putredinis]|uniref:Coupling of ubiquitin conjugation to ER degradation protein 1 n=1 Tax=Parascedosporium putredinis TaxID=1442378 RepID=A0A9P1GVE3_9PEZI|nr:unnamed protein product [Parascedosporium putredinis]CAI7987781.1 unnamed protein product [Parascedosporium putredinis]
MSDQQVSLPFLIVVLLTIGVATRYLFFSSPSSGSRQGNNPRNNAAQNASAMRLREVAAQRIQQMFPQVDRRTILWDLQRNGGSIQATTERVLAGRLETPPLPSSPRLPGSNPSTSTGAQQAKQPERPKQPDLITRYNLQNKVTSESSADMDKKKEGWSSNKDERQALLKKRRDEMILAARRKMEAKIVAEKTASGDASS